MGLVLSKWKRLLAFQLSLLLMLGLVSCDKPDLVVESGFPTPETREAVSPIRQVSEVSPPETIQQLRPLLDRYRPQVSIVSPKADTIFNDDTIAVRLDVRDLPIFQNGELELGPYIQLLLDDRPERAIYDLETPVILEGLSPGTHTLRAFAVRPWQESFKNEGAYAQTTFHIYTETGANTPDPEVPSLTYNTPRGIYGAQPILLDFYLANAPLHIVARESEEDDILDWRVRATVNGYSFVTDRWQPFYLTGFKPGKNWLKLEFLNEQGDPVPNTFNTTAEVIVYDPNQNDPLSQLIRGELSAEAARSIVDPNYTIEPSEPLEPTLEEISEPTVPEREPEIEPEIEPEPEIEETPEVLPEIPKETAPVTEEPSAVDETQETQEIELSPAESIEPEETTPAESQEPAVEVEAEPEVEAAPEVEIEPESIEASPEPMPEPEIEAVPEEVPQSESVPMDDTSS
ncbi:MAG: hypothetical protein J7641_23780 [Cyanobacteria bacterium SID2]|nr:hypothetical protein [Cyanobacteria bacterium SID2]